MQRVACSAQRILWRLFGTCIDPPGRATLSIEIAAFDPASDGIKEIGSTSNERLL